MLFTRRAFPWEIYRALRRNLPDPAVYIPNSTGGHLHPGRCSLSLVPRRLDPLPTEQRDLWYAVRDTLACDDLRDHIGERLGVDLAGTHPFSCLMRDTKGYTIDVHPDWDMKVATVQMYLPEAEIPGVGTEIYDADKRLVRQIPFAPNVAYAFKRTGTSYHAVSPIPDVVRDSIMLTYCREPWDEY